MKTNTANNISRLTALFLAGLALSTPASATSYTFTELKPLSGGASSTVSAINNLGQVVGTTSFTSSCWGCPGSSAVTLWNGTTATPVAGVNTYNTATDINDVGQVVGTGSPTYTTAYQAFVSDSTTTAEATRLTSTLSYTWANGINNFGQVAGVATEPNSSYGVRIQPVDATDW